MGGCASKQIPPPPIPPPKPVRLAPVEEVKPPPPKVVFDPYVEIEKAALHVVEYEHIYNAKIKSYNEHYECLKENLKDETKLKEAWDLEMAKQVAAQAEYDLCVANTLKAKAFHSTTVSLRQRTEADLLKLQTEKEDALAKLEAARFALEAVSLQKQAEETSKNALVARGKAEDIMQRKTEEVQSRRSVIITSEKDSLIAEKARATALADALIASKYQQDALNAKDLATQNLDRLNSDRLNSEVVFPVELKSIEIPKITMGYMNKEGRQFATWKRRFFILNNGILRYYESEDYPGSNSGKNILGEINLQNYDVARIAGSQKVLLFGMPNNVTARKLKLEIVSEEAAIHWMNALKAHIKYFSD
jgi:hypothetical protein